LGSWLDWPSLGLCSLGNARLEGLALAQGGNLGIDVQAEAGRHPPGLGHHEHRLGQFLPVALFEGPKLLTAHMQPMGLVVETDALGLTGLLQPLAKALQFRNQLGSHRWYSGDGKTGLASGIVPLTRRDTADVCGK
jgi:hypothetical protein